MGRCLRLLCGGALCFTAAPTLHPLHPPPLPRAPCRLSPSSSTLHPTGQPLRRARGLPLAKARAKPASPTPAPVSRVGVESQALTRPRWRARAGIATLQHRRASFSSSSSSRGCFKHPLTLIVCMCVRVSVCVWCRATCGGQKSTCSACVPAVGVRESRGAM